MHYWNGQHLSFAAWHRLKLAHNLLKQSLLRLGGLWIWGLHSKDKRQKGLRKVANACRLTFCLVCDQLIYLYIAQISNISSMTPSISNSMSSIAMTVLLIKESGVMGPQDTEEVTHQLGCPWVMLIFVRKSSLQSLEFIALVTKGMGHT